jgi:Ca2+-transporting ATPase
MPSAATENVRATRVTGDSPRPAWHAMPTEEVLKALDVTDAGLSTEEALSRNRRYGPNIVPKTEGDTVVQLIWRQVHNPLIWVLLAAGGIAMIADWHGDGIKNGIVILSAVLINTLIGFFQEFKASKAIESLSAMVPENVTGLRDGKRVTLSAAELVPGDLVLLASGDKVPADLRLIAARSLQIEEAALTGESVSSEKSIEPVDTGAVVGERSSMAFGGTLVTYGTGSGVVVGTGADTELGNISRMLREATVLQTPLTKALTSVGKYLAVGIVVVAVLMLITGTIRTELATGKGVFTSFRETLIFAIALAVGAIPEGLPAIVTIALAIGVQRMARRRAIIRKLPAVETLGSTTVICTDKTGTLTRNEMTVQSLWTPASGKFELEGVGYEPKGRLLKDAKPVPDGSADVRDLLLAGLLCNDSTIAHTNGKWTITGDPTEAALVVAAEKIGLQHESERRRNARIDAIPFESENQFMATLHATDRAPTIVVKGAPEVILRRCNVDEHDLVLREVEAMASHGMRVLALAWKPSDKATSVEMEDVQHGFELLGLQGMIDPPREEAIEAIRRCHRAGIAVKMITGDHKVTAHAIGRQLNITDAEHAAVTGAALAEMEESELRRVAIETNVFARVAPEHKLRLVRALQAKNHVVAMTGDGVNDAPALKQANIGVAMGITGTSVAREASDIILTDDNFASIAAAIEEGRRVYDNLVKSLAFLLPTNLGLAMIFSFPCSRHNCSGSILSRVSRSRCRLRLSRRSPMS